MLIRRTASQTTVKGWQAGHIRIHSSSTLKLRQLSELCSIFWTPIWRVTFRKIISQRPQRVLISMKILRQRANRWKAIVISKSRCSLSVNRLQPLRRAELLKVETSGCTCRMVIKQARNYTVPHHSPLPRFDTSQKFYFQVMRRSLGGKLPYAPRARHSPVLQIGPPGSFARSLHLLVVEVTGRGEGGNICWILSVLFSSFP